MPRASLSGSAFDSRQIATMLTAYDCIVAETPQASKAKLERIANIILNLSSAGVAEEDDLIARTKAELASGG